MVTGDCSSTGLAVVKCFMAAVYHFLLAADSSYVNAQGIMVDSGSVNGLTYAVSEKLSR